MVAPCLLLSLILALEQPLGGKRPESPVHDSMSLFKSAREAVSATEKPPLCAPAGWAALVYYTG